MSVFNRTKKYRQTSQDIEEKLKLLEKEEKKNIKEGMKTDKMYSEVEPVPEIPPIPAEYTDVPDSSGILDVDNFNQPGDETDQSTWDEDDFDATTLYKDHDDWLRNPAEMPNGQGTDNSIVLEIPPDLLADAEDSTGQGYYPPGSGLVLNGNYYGTAVGYISDGKYRGILSGGLTGGTNAPTEASRGYGGYYRSLNDQQFAVAVATWNAVYPYLYNQEAYSSKLIKCWAAYNRHHHYQRGGEYATWTGGPKSGGYIVEGVHLMAIGNKYRSSDFVPHVPAWNKVLKQSALGDGNDPENFPGPFKLLEKLFDKSKEALEAIADAAGELPDIPGFMPWEDAIEKLKDDVKGVPEAAKDFFEKFLPPEVKWGAEIAKSIDQNKPVQNKPSQRDIDKFIDGFNVDQIGVDTPVVSEPQNYSDDNFYVDDDGKVHTHTDQTIKDNPNKTSMATKTGDTGILGSGNPIGSMGQAQTQIVYPEDGSEPYFKYTDHAYHNLDSKDEGEVQGPAEKLADWVNNKANDKYNREDGDANTGGMEGYPPGIRGDLVTEFEIPLSDLPQEYKDAVEKELKYQDLVKQGKIKTNNQSNNQSNDQASNNQDAPIGDVAQLSSWEQKILRDGMNSKPTDSLKKKEQKRLMNMYGIHFPLAQGGGKSNQVAHYVPKGKLIEGVSYDFDKDPLVKKSDAFGNKQKPNTWFDPEDVQPEYPKKAPPKLKNNWHPKSPNLKKSKRFEKVKVSSQDLIRHYKVNATEIEQYHKLVDAINQFIEDHPGQAKLISDRYPAHDSRLAELNWKMDQMMKASHEYIEQKFPENEKVTGRIKRILSKTIKMTDPKSFKMDPTPPKYIDYKQLKLREDATRYFKKPVKLKSWHKGHLTNS